MSGHNVFPDGMPAELAGTHPCVFISHRSTDKQTARQVARFFENIGLHYWFDEQDLMLDRALGAGHSRERALVESIDMGIRHCTDLLGIVSGNTFTSWWVPYEIGSARAAGRDTAFIILHDVPYIPEYVRIARAFAEREAMCTWSILLALGRRREVTALGPGNEMSGEWRRSDEFQALRSRALKSLWQITAWIERCVPAPVDAPAPPWSGEVDSGTTL